MSIGAEGEEHSTDVMRIARPDGVTDLASLGLSLAEGKMAYRTAAEVLAQLFPVDAGAAPETLRRHTFKTAEALLTQAGGSRRRPAPRRSW